MPSVTVWTLAVFAVSKFSALITEKKNKKNLISLYIEEGIDT